MCHGCPAGIQRNGHHRHYAFDESLINEFGWSRGALKFRDLITFLLTGLVAPFMGIIIDKIGTRKLMIGGSILLSIAYLGYSQIDSLIGMYLIHVLFAVVLVACGLNVAIILVSQWFKVHRGTAIGIALVGTSLGGVFFPAIIPGLIAEHGWRESFQLVALVPVIVLLIAAFVIRSHPSLMGMTALGKANQNDQNSSNEAPEVQRTSTRGLDYWDAIKTRTFWALSTVAMMTFYSMLAAAAHLFLHMRDMQFDPATAGQALSLMFGMALIGKFAFGLLADHLNQKLVFLGNQAVMIAGAICLATLSPELIWTAITIFGLGWGGLYTLLQLQAVNSFGLKAAGKYSVPSLCLTH